MALMDRGAFDGAWNQIENSACFCAGCFCMNSMLDPCRPPCCFGQGKVCCSEIGVASGQQCCADEKGCVFGVAKFCCLVSSVSTATSNMACGACDVFCCGRPYGEGMRVEDQENSYMEGVHWLLYCLIGGVGCARPSPCVAADVKICCIEAKATTADGCCGDEGCIAVRHKTCCCVHQVQLPPTMSLGLGCCCIPCINRERLSARSPHLNAAA